MPDEAIARCRDCGADFPYDPGAHTRLTPKGPVCVPPRRCSACQQAREAEDMQLLAAAREDRSLAHSYRCRGCRRIFLLLRPWKRAGGLLFCPECRPGYFRQNPLDAELNRAHGYPKY